MGDNLSVCGSVMDLPTVPRWGWKPNPWKEKQVRKMVGGSVLALTVTEMTFKVQSTQPFTSEWAISKPNPHWHHRLSHSKTLYCYLLLVKTEKQFPFMYAFVDRQLNTSSWHCAHVPQMLTAGTKLQGKVVGTTGACAQRSATCQNSHSASQRLSTAFL